MECLRNLPSKTNAFQTATYERVRTEHSHNKPFFATSGQEPHQVLASSDENLILAVIRQKNQVPKSTDEHLKRQTTPEQGEAEDATMEEDTGSSQQQQTQQLQQLQQSTPPPRLYKRPRIALSNAATRTANSSSSAAKQKHSSAS